MGAKLKWRTPLNASDDELLKVIGKCERAALYGAGAVILGLISEAVLAFCHPAYDSFGERWGSVIADVLIAAGVAAEVLFARMGSARQEELRRRADVEIAGLRERTAPRALTEDQFRALQTLRGAASHVCLVSGTDFESSQFAGQIARALQSVGIAVSMGAPRVGVVWRSIHLVLPAPQPLSNLANDRFVKAFRLANIAVGVSSRAQYPLIDLPAGVPIIMVGEKPNLHETPPYVARLASGTAVSVKVDVEEKGP